MLEKLRSGEADMVIGDRLSNGTYFDENKRPFHDFGNNLVRNTITRMYKTKILDVMTGYRGCVMKLVNIYSRITGIPVTNPNKKKKMVQIPKKSKGL